ncbi:MAG: ABC-2 family transporter protein [Roseburia sp.]|nr:ABC-2 family transporter protein [Roseburia sp.]
MRVSLKENLVLYFHYLSIALRSSMQYKTSFFLIVTGRFLVSFNAILGAYFVFQRFHVVKGYEFGEVLLCFSIIQMSFSLCEAVSHGFSNFAGIVRRGGFDRILLRPRSAILQLLGSEFDVSRIGMLLQGLVMFVYGIVISPVDWTWGRVITVVMMLSGGTVLFASIFLLEAALSFFTLEGLEAVNILSYGAKEHGKYPVDIYGKGMMKFCTYVIPYALIQYYPLQYLLGRADAWYYSLYPLGTLPFALVCYYLWRLGIRHYQSAGS